MGKAGKRSGCGASVARCIAVAEIGAPGAFARGRDQRVQRIFCQDLVDALFPCKLQAKWRNSRSATDTGARSEL